MQCTKCGAEVQPGATVCPSCEARIVPSKQAVAAPRRRDVAAAAKAATKSAPKPARKPFANPFAKSAAKPFANPFTRPTAKPTAKAIVAPSVEKMADEASPSVKAASSRKGPFASPTWLAWGMIAVVVVLAAGGAWLAFSTASTGANTPDAVAVRFLQALAVYDAKGLLDNSTHASFDATSLAAFQRDAPSKAAALSGRPDYKDITIKSVTPSGVDPGDPNTRVVHFSAQQPNTITGAYSLQPDSSITVVLKSGKWLVLWN